MLFKPQPVVISSVRLGEKLNEKERTMCVFIREA